jgi:hypothetical protein
VTGDSIALRLVPAFEARQGTDGYTVTDRTVIGCTLESGATGRRLPDGSDGFRYRAPSCDEGWASAVGRDRPDVVLVSLAGQVSGDWQIQGRWVHPCDPVYDAWFQRRVADGLAMLTAGGARVVLALQAPSFDADFSRRIACGNADETRAALSVPGAYTVDFRSFVCPGGHCTNEVDGITLREDGRHYEGLGAELAVRWIAPRLHELAAATP